MSERAFVMVSIETNEKSAPLIVEQLAELCDNIDNIESCNIDWDTE